MKKVLIIPSWYLNHKQDMSGSFFREQALLLANDFDLKVIYFKFKNISLLFYYFIKILDKIKLIHFYLHKLFLKEQFEDSIDTYFFTLYTCSRINEGKNSWFLKWQAGKVANIFFTQQNWKPDLVHAHSTFYAGIFANEIKNTQNIPYIITEHLGPFFAHAYGRYTFGDAKIAIENADKICAVSTHQAKMILMHGFRCKPIVVGNYVDEANYPIKNISGKLSNAKIRILTIGNSQFVKDHETFVMCIKQLLSMNYLVEAVVVGSVETPDDKDKCVYYQKAKQLGIEKEFIIKGQIPRLDMSNIYLESDFFVSSSIAESFGIAVCEAILSGLPTIVVSNGGVDDIYNGENCFVVPMQDYITIAEIIVNIKTSHYKLSPEDARNSIIVKFGNGAFRSRIKKLYLETITNTKE